jgi:rod shape-determining protein MreC
MYMRRTSNQNKWALLIICFILFLVVLSVNSFQKRDLNKFERVLKDTEIFVAKVIYAPVGFIKDKFKSNNNISAKEKTAKKTDKNTKKKTTSKEVTKTKESKKTAKEEYDEAKIDELENEVNKLKKQLKLNTTLREKDVLNATTINRYLDSIYQNINIDKGKKHGVIKGMAVINPEGLIGTITKTGNYSSTVKLLTSDTFDKISVRIKVDDYYIYGLLSSYKSKNNVFIIEGIADNFNVLKGATVTTTGMGKTFPAGLLVGKVKKVTTDNFDLAQIVEVTPAANFKNIDYVSVVRRDQNYEN